MYTINRPYDFYVKSTCENYKAMQCPTTTNLTKLAGFAMLGWKAISSVPAIGVWEYIKRTKFNDKLTADNLQKFINTVNMLLPAEDEIGNPTEYAIKHGILDLPFEQLVTVLLQFCQFQSPTLVKALIERASLFKYDQLNIDTPLLTEQEREQFLNLPEILFHEPDMFLILKHYGASDSVIIDTMQELEITYASIFSGHFKRKDYKHSAEKFEVINQVLRKIALGDNTPIHLLLNLYNIELLTAWPNDDNRWYRQYDDNRWYRQWKSNPYL